MSDDEGDSAAAGSSAPAASFDPAARALAASLQFRAQTQQPQSLRRVSRTAKHTGSFEVKAMHRQPEGSTQRAAVTRSRGSGCSDSLRACVCCCVSVQLCARELASAPADSPSAALLQFWQSFACSRLGTAEGTEAAIASLEALLLSAAGSELGLPIVALLLSAHNARTVGKDKRRLLDLKSKLKVVSKQSSEAGLQLAGRYFLASNKVPKARQCQ